MWIRKLGTAAAAIALVCAAGGCAPGLRGVRVDEVRQTGTKVSFAYNRDATFQALAQACFKLGYWVDAVDSRRHLITGTSPVSLVADSEHFAIHVAQADFDMSEAYFASSLALKSQLLGERKSVRHELVRQAVALLARGRTASQQAK